MLLFLNDAAILNCGKVWRYCCTRMSGCDGCKYEMLILQTAYMFIESTNLNEHVNNLTTMKSFTVVPWAIF